jgi:hypothetical protein
MVRGLGERNGEVEGCTHAKYIAPRHFFLYQYRKGFAQIKKCP